MSSPEYKFTTARDFAGDGKWCDSVDLAHCNCGKHVILRFSLRGRPIALYEMTWEMAADLTAEIAQDVQDGLMRSSHKPKGRN